MKTSNKLLLGLFGAILLAMIVVNVMLKKEIDQNPMPVKNMNGAVQNDSTTTQTKSIHINF